MDLFLLPNRLQKINVTIFVSGGSREEAFGVVVVFENNWSGNGQGRKYFGEWWSWDEISVKW